MFCKLLYCELLSFTPRTYKRSTLKGEEGGRVLSERVSHIVMELTSPRRRFDPFLIRFKRLGHNFGRLLPSALLILTKKIF